MCDTELEANTCTTTTQLDLIVQYYKCTTSERQKEIDTCLVKNLLNPHITSLHILTEEEFDFSAFPCPEKIHQVNIHQRLTYEYAFIYANNWPETTTWILSNADIYFDESLCFLNGADLANRIFALTRHEVQLDGSIRPMSAIFAHGSQDAWIFTTPLPIDRLFADFFLGIPGCDNRIAYEFIKAGIIVLNPSNIVIARHLDLVLDKDIFQRQSEYAELITEENISNGKVAPPPYQYHLYPIDQVTLSSFELYRYIQNLNELNSKTCDKNNLNGWDLWQRLKYLKVLLKKFITQLFTYKKISS